jgi:hypothetical protein
VKELEDGHFLMEIMGETVVLLICRTIAQKSKSQHCSAKTYIRVFILVFPALYLNIFLSFLFHQMSSSLY